MNKEILQEYIDACELVKETEKDIIRLNQKKKTIIQTNVKGSMHEFPYLPQHFKVQGTTFTLKDDSRIRRAERLLEQRKSNAEQIKLQVEEWMLTIPLRMQRIYRFAGNFLLILQKNCRLSSPYSKKKEQIKCRDICTLPAPILEV